MHRGVHVGFILVPLITAFGFLLFATFTEYWTRLDYSLIKPLNDQTRKNYQIKQIRLEIPKYTGLFGECDEYKLINLLEPIKINGQSSSSNSDSLTTSSIQTTTTSILEESSSNNDELIAEALKTDDENSGECLTKEKCEDLNKKAPNTCFCCNELKRRNNNDEYECCYYASAKCDGIYQCKDHSDELNSNCPTRKLYYSSRYYDDNNKCLRHSYDLWKFVKQLFNLDHHLDNLSNSISSRRLVFNETSKQKESDKIHLNHLFTAESYTIRIFSSRLITLVSIICCIFFTILCLLTLLCVTCCHNLVDIDDLDANVNKIDQRNDYNFALANEEDFEIGSLSSSYKKKSRSCCCKCNCLLCPFAFFSFFSLLTFLACLVALCSYIYSICLVRNSYLIYDQEYIPEHLIHAYQYNSWLFDLIKFGISFYAILISFLLYLLVFIMSTCISCRIQMSPSWKYRNKQNHSYDLLHHSPGDNGNNYLLLNRNNKIKQDIGNLAKSNSNNNNSKNNTTRSSKIYNKRDSDGGFSSKFSN
jgi:hypothetical protein